MNYKVPYESALIGKGIVVTREKQVKKYLRFKFDFSTWQIFIGSYFLTAEIALRIGSDLFQTLLHEVPGSHYVIEAEVSNSGVKFSDTFIFSIRYCLVQKSVSTTHVRITGHVQFIKSVYSLVKRNHECFFLFESVQYFANCLFDIRRNY